MLARSFIWLWLAIHVNAQVTVDFSNNLVNDLGPLLSLFGGSMTRQFLSESTHLSDYLLFAIGPIGIITAITSVIRVCGSSTLRAFIGKANESPGEVEVDLCTSTSRDVCELFNVAGITRVLGRPKILEVIQMPIAKPILNPSSTGIGLLREHLQQLSGRLPDPSRPEWKRQESSISRLLRRTNPKPVEFPPNPNLSLNVATKRRSEVLVYICAVLGFLIQIGVLTMAALGSRRINGDEVTIGQGGRFMPEGDAALAFIIGTVAVSVGMFLCAFLIGESTLEDFYVRKKPGQPVPPEDRRSSHICWIQPGFQDVGDQTFSAFAYLEHRSGKHISQYVSSRKNEHIKHFEIRTLFAILLLLAGYITQFIGLRGTSTFVAISQLGLTIVMSLIRGLVRSRNLESKDNQLIALGDLVHGHELDWLALEYSAGDNGPMHKTPKGTQKRPTRQVLPFWQLTGKATASQTAKVQGDSQANPPVSPKSQAITDVFHYRTRLANLTGHLGSSATKSYDQWGDELVKVRKIARQLTKTLAQAADALLDSAEARDINVDLEAFISNETKGSVRLIIEAPTENRSGQWYIDSSEMEAILGLSLWSYFIENQTLVGSLDGKTHATAEPVPRKQPTHRIVSAQYLDENSSDQTNSMEAYLQAWIGRRNEVFETAVLRLTRGKTYSCLSVFYESKNASGTSVRTRVLTVDDKRINRSIGRRFSDVIDTISNINTYIDRYRYQQPYINRYRQY